MVLSVWFRTLRLLSKSLLLPVFTDSRQETAAPQTSSWTTLIPSHTEAWILYAIIFLSYHGIAKFIQIGRAENADGNETD